MDKRICERKRIIVEPETDRPSLAPRTPLLAGRHKPVHIELMLEWRTHVWNMRNY